MIEESGPADTREGEHNSGRGYGVSTKASSRGADGDARILGSDELLPRRP